MCDEQAFLPLKAPECLQSLVQDLLGKLRLHMAVSEQLTFLLQELGGSPT